jgi:hypothetical protein
MSGPVIINAGGKMIAATPGQFGNTITIDDAAALKEIRDLLEQRKKVGMQLTQKLKSLGLNITEDDETVQWNSVG